MGQVSAGVVIKEVDMSALGASYDRPIHHRYSSNGTAEIGVSHEVPRPSEEPAVDHESEDVPKRVKVIVRT